MPDFDLGEGLGALAGHGARTGRLSPAADIRRRADRRRGRRRAAAAAAGVVAVLAVGAGIAFAQPDGRPPLPPAVSPSSAVSPSPAVSPAPSFAARGSGEQETGLSFRRGYRIVPSAVPEPVSGLALGDGGRFEVPVIGDDATFTLATVSQAPVTEEWLIRLDEEGRSRCVAIQENGSLGLATCAPAKVNQRFELRRGADDRLGRPTYGILARDPARRGWVTWNPAATAVVVTDRPVLDDVRGWVFIDEGPSTLAD